MVQIEVHVGNDYVALTNDVINQASARLKALTRRQRFPILRKFVRERDENDLDGWLCVKDIQDFFQIPQSEASQAISDLSALGLLENRKEGKYRFYRVHWAGLIEYAKFIKQVYEVAEKPVKSWNYHQKQKLRREIDSHTSNYIQ